MGHQEGMLIIEITTTQITIMIIKEEKEQTRIITTNKITTQMIKMTINNKYKTRKNRGKTERKEIGRTNNKDRENKDKCKNEKEAVKPHKQGQPKGLRCQNSRN